jgi:hypothetical protein
MSRTPNGSDVDFDRAAAYSTVPQDVRAGQPVGEPDAQTRLLQGRDHGVGALRRIVDVRRVLHGRDAGVQGRAGAERLAQREVVGGQRRPDVQQHAAEVGVQGVRDGVSSQDALPHVPVRVDHAGDDDAPRGVDHFLAVGGL